MSSLFRNNTGSFIRFVKWISLLIAVLVILSIWFVRNKNKIVTIAEDIPDIQTPVRYQSSADITVEDLYHYISVLASDSLEGRAAGTAGEQKAIDFICEKLSDYGLNSHIQSFRFLKRGLTWQSSFSFGQYCGILNRDFIPTLPIDSCSVSGEVIFTGDGYRYTKSGKILNDYGDVDVRGKWVMFFEEVVSVGWRLISERYHVAQKNGAAGVLTIRQDSASNGQLVPRGFSYSTGMNAFQIPMIRISEKTADSLFRYVGYKTSEILNEMKDKQWNIQIPVKVNVSVHTRRDSLKSNNIIACLEGNDSILKKEYIIVGAHYDHIGTQTFPTLTGDSALIYHGADDNASGTAGVLELAEKIVSAGGLKRSLIFILFGAEEQGLQGANYFCNHFPVPPDQIQLMINMDMIGRMDSLKKVYVHTDVSNEQLLKKILVSHPDVALIFDTNSRMRSDHRPFADKKIPVAYFTTGHHPEYHTPKDKLHTINFDGEKNILDLIDDFIVLKSSR